MRKLSRIVLAISIFLIGAALIPFVGLPQDGFRWQLFADVYNPMILEINYGEGSPGSFFTVNGSNFPPDEPIAIYVNGGLLGTVNTDGSGDPLGTMNINSPGDLTFILDSGPAPAGYYIITTSVLNGPQANFRLDPSAPLRTQEGEGTVFVLPEDLPAWAIHLPVMHK
jgi:hypothetical protein